MVGIVIFVVAGYLAAKRHLPAVCPLFWKAIGIYIAVSALLLFGQLNPYRYTQLLTDAQYDEMVSNYLPLAIGSWIAVSPFRVVFYFLARFVCKFFFKDTAPSNSTAEPVPAEEEQPAPVGQMAVPKWSSDHQPMGKIKTASEKQ